MVTDAKKTTIIGQAWRTALIMGLVLVLAIAAVACSPASSLAPALPPAPTSAPANVQANPTAAPVIAAPKPTASTPAPKAYIGLFKDNAIAVIDTGTNKLVKTIPIPTGPHGLVITPDGRWVYASSDGDSKVSVIDTATDTIKNTIEVGKAPHGLAITPDGKQVLVAVFGTSNVVFIDTTSNQVTAKVPVPNPHNIAISPNGNLAYVAAQKPGAFGLAILDVEQKSQTGNIPLDKTPRALNFSPDGKLLYFTQAGVDAVQVLDPETDKISTQIPVGASPHHPIFTPDGKEALVVAQGPGELDFIDPASGGEILPLKVGQMPHWIGITSDGRYAYVTNEASNNVSVVDLNTSQVTATVPVGQAPRKIVVQPGMSIEMPMNPAEPTNAPPSARATEPANSPAQNGSTIAIAKFAFAPKTITVKVGQEVTWTNNDAVVHTVTSDGKVWDSGDLAPGQSFSFKFDKPGTYTFHCSYHPYMKGEIVVTG